jgi:hypothetical protein
MINPAQLKTGHSFERKNIEEWFAKGNKINPSTGLELSDFTLTDNLALKGAITEWKEAQKKSSDSNKPLRLMPSAPPLTPILKKPSQPSAPDLATLPVRPVQPRPQNQASTPSLFNHGFFSTIRNFFSTMATPREVPAPIPVPQRKIPSLEEQHVLLEIIAHRDYILKSCWYTCTNRQDKVAILNACEDLIYGNISLNYFKDLKNIYPRFNNSFFLLRSKTGEIADRTERLADPSLLSIVKNFFMGRR